MSVFRAGLFSLLGLAMVQSCGADPVPMGTTQWPNGNAMEQWGQAVSDAGGTTRHGLYQSWYESGLPKDSGQYVSGEKSGLWTRWYDADPAVKLWEGEYVDDKREGRWTYWRDPSHAHMGHTGHDHAHNGDQSATEMMAEVKHEHYQNGLAHGQWISWHSNGQQADSMTYVSGQLEGMWRSYHPNGVRQSESNYLNGKLQGPIMIWDSLGQAIVADASVSAE